MYVSRGVASNFVLRGPKYTTYSSPRLKHGITAVGGTRYLRTFSSELLKIWGHFGRGWGEIRTPGPSWPATPLWGRHTAAAAHKVRWTCVAGPAAWNALSCTPW